MSRHPETLIANVVAGKPPGGAGHRDSSAQRARAPSAPPAATAPVIAAWLRSTSSPPVVERGTGRCLVSSGAAQHGDPGARDGGCPRIGGRPGRPGRGRDGGPPGGRESPPMALNAVGFVGTGALSSAAVFYSVALLRIGLHSARKAATTLVAVLAG